MYQNWKKSDSKVYHGIQLEESVFGLNFCIPVEFIDFREIDKYVQYFLDSSMIKKVIISEIAKATIVGKTWIFLDNNINYQFWVNNLQTMVVNTNWPSNSTNSLTACFYYHYNQMHLMKLDSKQNRNNSIYLHWIELVSTACPGIDQMDQPKSCI